MTTNANKTSVLPVRGMEYSVLATTLTGNSGWVDLSGLLNWSVFFSGLESGATIKIELANGLTAPAGSGVFQTPLTPDTNGNASYVCAAAPYHWVRFSKVQGSTPTATTGILHALFA